MLRIDNVKFTCTGASYDVAGKDTVIFVDKADHQKPNDVKFEVEEEEEPGLIFPNGEINWACPCLGGMATGPCGFEFREAFSCFHHSNEETKGSECYEQFRGMQQCMTSYPDLYGDNDKKEDNGEDLDGAFEQLDAETKDGKFGGNLETPDADETSEGTKQAL